MSRFVHLSTDEWNDIPEDGDRRKAVIQGVRDKLDLLTSIRLTERQKVILEKIFWEGQTQVEVASELGITHQAVSDALRAIKRKACKHLAFPPT